MTRSMWETRRTVAPLGGVTALAVVAAGVVFLAARPDGRADQTVPKAAASPLDFVPADAAAVWSVRVADLWNYPALKPALEKVGADLPPLREINKLIAVPLDEVDRLTVIVDSARGPEHVLIGVTTLKPYDKKAILGALAPPPADVRVPTDPGRPAPVPEPAVKETEVGDRSYYDIPRGMSVAFLDGNTYLLGRGNELESYLKRSGTKVEGPLTPVLQLASEKHLLIAGVDAAAVAAAAPKSEQPPDWVKPLLKARLGTLTVDLDGEVRANGRVTFKTEADAKDGAAGLNDALDLVRGQFVQMKAALTRGVDSPKFAALLENVGAALRAARAEQKGTVVEVAAAVKLDPKTTQAAVAEGVKVIQKASKRIQISNDLKQLALAVHNYNDTLGRLPAPAIYDKAGKPLLSWRVMLLPYIEQQNLYLQFHLDEPWDSDHNKKLLEKMPPQFAPPGSQAFKDHETHFQALVGKGTVFEPPSKPQPGMVANGLRMVGDIPDGLSNTILFVEAKKAVPWTKPEDVSLDDGKLLPKLGGLSEGGFLVALCDGSVHFFPKTMKEETLRIWATRNNGMVRPEPEK